MEAERKRKLARRNPLSDCTNTPSSSLPLNPTKLNPSYSSSAPKKPTTTTTTRFTSSTNLDLATNLTSPLPTTLLSTPSPKASSLNVQGGRSFSNLRKVKGKEVATPVSSTPILNKRKDKGKEVGVHVTSTPILSKRNDGGTFDVEASEPFSAIYSRRSFLDITKGDKEKEFATSESSTPILNTRKDNGKEVAILATSTPIFGKRNDKGKEVAIPVSSGPVLNTRKDNGIEVAVLASCTPILSKRNDDRTFDGEASEPISAVYSRRSFSNLRKGKGKEVEIPLSSTSILNKRKDKGKEVAIPASSKPVLSKRNDKAKDVAISVSDTPILKVSDIREKCDGVEGANLPKAKALTDPGKKKHHAVSSEQHVLQDPASKKRKDRGKEVAIPVSSTSVLQVYDSRGRNYGVEGENLPKAKASTVPCRKKQRAAFEDPLLQDYIEKQKAYFKMIDEFELPVEEVCSINEIE